MKKLCFILLLLTIITACRPFEETADTNKMTAQPSEQTYKPWAYWWWMGSSVTKEGISKNLKAYQEAGIGGMHIIPIYGEKGDEENFIDYLSPQWMDMLVHTLNEAEKLGLGIDMTTGTGWPFGGPKVSFATSAKKMELKAVDLSTLKDLNALTKGIKGGQLVALSVQTSDGSYKDILEETQKTNGLKNAKAYTKAVAMILSPTRQQVKRAAPGAKGLVLDYFNKEALNSYFNKFQTAFDSTQFSSAKIRSFYNDSYEVYGANSTVTFLDKFKELRSYDITKELHELSNPTQSETKERIRTDYCETISDLLLSEFTIPWDAKSNAMGMITRNQAHGSPGNLLDLYAATDIPETESFGVSDLTIPGLRQDPDFEEDRFGRPNPLTMKFASSAAHLTGKKLVASETATWLGDHFKVALSQVKPQIDELFTAGINHIVYHGITYTPPEKPFPGRLFYASTNFGTKSHFWKELPALNSYIENCQRVLQNSKPMNDVLVYFPIHDVWAKNQSDEILVRFDVHHYEKWLQDSNFGTLISNLWNDGFTFDYISDKMLESAEFSDGKIALKGGNYKTIVIPNCNYMPEDTLEKLRKLAKQGAPIIFQEQLPTSVPGYYDLENRIEELEAIKTAIQPLVKTNQNISLELLQAGVENESLAKLGLSFIRKTNAKEDIYFISNLGDTFRHSEVQLSIAAKEVELMDPLTGETRTIASKIMAGNTVINLHLEPGQSCILKLRDSQSTAAKFTDYITINNPITINAEWTITPKGTEQQLPKPKRVSDFTSWTTYSDAWSIYSGKAVYSCEFELEDKSVGKEMLLDLGDVRETARVKINGKDLGLLWCIPFKTIVPKDLLQKKNTIEIEVTNLSFNKVIDLDRKKVPWKNFHEINFVNIKYERYDASDKEPVLSGLLSDIKLFSIEKTAKQ